MSTTFTSRRTRRALAGLAVLALLIGAGGVWHHVEEERATAAAACPPGSEHLGAELGLEAGLPAGTSESSKSRLEKAFEAATGFGRLERALDGRRTVARDPELPREFDPNSAGPCWPLDGKLPEPYAELATMRAGTMGQLGLASPGAMAQALAQSQVLARSGVPNSGGTWEPVGDYLEMDDPEYMGSGWGLSQASGRMSAYALGPNGIVYAAAANGGVWKSTDTAKTWTDISLRLPNQTVGSMAWTSAGGARGTILALTGDNSWGRYNFAGSGLYYTTDEGATWLRASGIPDGATAYKVAVAPDAPNVVYAGTGVGLFRSTDAGRTWVNVKLPTVAGCWDHPFTEECALSSAVTDVVVRGKDTFGHGGGAVTAAVGWRGGAATNKDGVAQAPNNGIYVSDTGAPGTFTKVADAAGFAPTANVGRVSLGNAYGPDQDHDYLYALVQDSQLLVNGGIDMGVVPNDLLDTGLGGLAAGKIATYVNGAYVSDDFGRTWTKMAGTEQFLNPASGSAMIPLLALGLGPGAQSWYNNWIQPDPYKQDPLTGAPTSLLLGMEEVWQSATDGTPQIAPTDFRAVTQYHATTIGCVLAGSPCGALVKTTGVTGVHPDQHTMLFLPPRTGELQRQAISSSDGGNYVADVPLAGFFKATDFVAHQTGLNTLLPYGFGVSKDGTVVVGLQDNGGAILPKGEGHWIEVITGDGGSAMIDPDDSQDIVVGAGLGASFDKSTRGGKGTNSILDAEIVDPDTGPRYVFPQIRQDYAKPTRIILGGQKVYTADTPIQDLTSDSWKLGIDLGDGLVTSANDIYDGTAYVGYCTNPCETLTSGRSFGNGIATNYGGTWHKAAARGLPSRLINTVLVDHTDPAVVYAGLGLSTGRMAFKPGLTGPGDGVTPTGGYLYRSTDGGQTFHDITGDLPRVGVVALQQYGHQLLVGGPVGAFISSDLEGSSYGRLGTNLPTAPVSQFQFRPGTTDQLYVSTYGRGVYRTTLTASPAGGASGGASDGACVDTVPPSISFARHQRSGSAPYALAVRGTATDRGCGARVRQVAASVQQERATSCRFLKADGAWTRWLRTDRACSGKRYLIRATGAARWTIVAPRRLLASGKDYQVWIRATDAAGNAERVSRSRNRLTVRVGR